MGPTDTFSARLWEPDIEPSWVFVTLPTGISDEIGDLVPSRPGFGSVRVESSIGDTRWTTSLFPSKQARSYVLPIKRAVRQSQELDVGDIATVTVRLLLN